MDYRYGILWRGKLVRISRSLDSILMSEVCKPGCVIVRFEYDDSHKPVHAEILEV